MRKIDLTPYPRYMAEINEKGEERHAKGSLVDKVATQLRGLLLSPARDLSGVALLAAWKVAEKIKDGEDVVLLEEPEWEELKVVFTQLRGFGPNHIEMVRRVLEAPQVEVKER